MREFFALHPYWAFCPKSGVRLMDRLPAERIARLNAPEPDLQSTEWLNIKSNNYGFFNHCDYPYFENVIDRPFILGVFGGSVALWFYLQEGRSFAGELAAKLGGGRRVEILNFGLGGCKQPQTTFAFTYFLMLRQRFDAVLLLDGFNDAVLSWVNISRGSACSFPSVSHMDMFDDIPCLFELKPQADLNNPADRVKEIASIWEQGARLMQGISHERGIRLFHVLQPNQYHSKKDFSEEERRIALSETTPYRDAVRAVYPELVDRIGSLRREGWNAFDATGIFDNRTETVYSDNCCHYNRLGNAILGDFILGEMLQNGVLDGPYEADARDSPGHGIVRGIRNWLAPRRRSSDNAKRDVPNQNDNLYPMW